VGFTTRDDALRPAVRTTTFALRTERLRNTLVPFFEAFIFTVTLLPGFSLKRPDASVVPFLSFERSLPIVATVVSATVPSHDATPFGQVRRNATSGFFLPLIVADPAIRASASLPLPPGPPAPGGAERLPVGTADAELFAA
jgi:hypothetical protein